MLNRNEFYHKNGLEINNILEIRINHDAWAKIVRIASSKKKSYSWVVRYCVFRMIKRKNKIQGWNLENRRNKFEALSKEVKKHRSDKDLHRHKLCLYGSDELLIRMTAGYLSCTMSHLVRLALLWNLDELERMSARRNSCRFHRLSFYWLGIKLYEDVELPTLSIPDQYFQLIGFNELSYW